MHRGYLAEYKIYKNKQIIKKYNSIKQQEIAMPKNQALKNIDKILDTKPIPERLYKVLNFVRSQKEYKEPPKRNNIGKVVFVASRKEINSGNYKIDELKTFSKNTGIRVLIPKYAEIENGKIKYLEQ